MAQLFDIRLSISEQNRDNTRIDDAVFEKMCDKWIDTIRNPFEDELIKFAVLLRQHGYIVTATVDGERVA